MKKNNLDKIFQKHNEALRNPSEIFAGNLDSSGITEKTLEFKADRGMIEVLNKLEISLVLTREYENLVLCFSVIKNKIVQTFFHYPHPSGIVYDKSKKSLYVAGTRNPNQIIQLKKLKDGNLMPVRSIFFSGNHYIHDLVLIDGEIYANAVGKNAVVRIDMNSTDSPRIVWWPKSIEKNKKPDFSKNYLQLNSISAAKKISDSYFTASDSKITKFRPGDLRYKVDGQGVVINGKTRDIVVKGLTRPHSLRNYKNKFYLDNSGYGQFGVVDLDKKIFIPKIKLPGWTRGLIIYKGIAFVGTSKVLPRFKNYAPGVDQSIAICAVFAIDIKTWKVLGKIEFPYGNQIFGIEAINGYTKFPFKNLGHDFKKEKDIFFKY